MPRPLQEGVRLAPGRFLKLTQERLKTLGLSIQAAEHRYGLPRESIRWILKGHIPSLDRAWQVAQALGIPLFLPLGAAEKQGDANLPVAMAVSKGKITRTGKADRVATPVNLERGFEAVRACVLRTFALPLARTWTLRPGLDWDFSRVTLGNLGGRGAGTGLSFLHADVRQVSHSLRPWLKVRGQVAGQGHKLAVSARAGAARLLHLEPVAFRTGFRPRHMARNFINPPESGWEGQAQHLRCRGRAQTLKPRETDGP